MDADGVQGSQPDWLFVGSRRIRRKSFFLQSPGHVFLTVMLAYIHQGLAYDYTYIHVSSFRVPPSVSAVNGHCLAPQNFLDRGEARRPKA